MITRNSTKGFSPVEIVVVVFVVTVLGLGGWYVWQRNRDATPNSDISRSQQPNTNKTPEQDQTAEDPTESWISYSSNKGKFSLKYPSTWMLPSNMEQCEEDSAEKSQLMVGPNEESAGKCQSGNSGQVYIKSLAGDQRSPTESDTTSTEVTIQGQQGTKYTSVATEEEGFHPNGTKLVTYEFYTNGRTYKASYRQWPTETDQLAVFETIVEETLKFRAE